MDGSSEIEREVVPEDMVEVCIQCAESSDGRLWTWIMDPPALAGLNESAWIAQVLEDGSIVKRFACYGSSRGLAVDQAFRWLADPDALADNADSIRRSSWAPGTPAKDLDGGRSLFTRRDYEEDYYEYDKYPRDPYYGGYSTPKAKKRSKSMSDMAADMVEEEAKRPEEEG